VKQLHASQIHRPTNQHMTNIKVVNAILDDITVDLEPCIWGECEILDNVLTAADP